jgi:hypothetical protein
VDPRLARHSILDRPHQLLTGLLIQKTHDDSALARQELAKGKGNDMVEEGSISTFSTLSMAGLSKALTMRGEGEIVEDGTILLDHRLEPGEAQLEITPAAGGMGIKVTPELLAANGLPLLGGPENANTDHQYQPFQGSGIAQA